MTSLAYYPTSSFKYEDFNSGGTVLTGSPYNTHNGITVARKGDQVMCKKLEMRRDWFLTLCHFR
ncbi:PAAR domain-containing protein [Psychrobacter alimentarius]|uniref:PAAR domain-containing protein n=1 Tax=Psychrobacter alimentarius TaxID=261164 RepID=UPI003FD0F61F